MITAMKAETNPPKSWKEIMAAIDKESESQLKDHWKAIKPKTEEEQKKGEGQVKAMEGKARNGGGGSGGGKKVCLNH